MPGITQSSSSNVPLITDTSTFCPVYYLLEAAECFVTPSTAKLLTESLPSQPLLPLHQKQLQHHYTANLVLLCKRVLVY